jgi:hypothetical protein
MTIQTIKENNSHICVQIVLTYVVSGGRGKMHVLKPLTTWCKATVQKCIVTQVIDKLPPFMEPKISVLCSQKPVTGLYSDPVESNLYPHTVISEIHFNITLPSMPKVVSSLQVFHIKYCLNFSSPQTCYTSQPSHLPLVKHPLKLVKNINYEAPHYVIFSILLLLSLELCSQTFQSTVLSQSVRPSFTSANVS